MSSYDSYSGSGGWSDGFGLSHLQSMPITLTVGIVLLAVLLVLVLLRFVFADVRISGGVR